MPFDALFLQAITAELQESVGSRIDKVQQPSRDTILLSLRKPGWNHKLLICINPGRPRVQLTGLSFENPPQPPMFCMLLRKHLIGARILSVLQIPMERLLTITLDSPDELENRSEKQLIVELTGRSSNLILVGSDKRIIDCVRRVDPEMSETRQLLPGLFYHAPDPQGKFNPYTLRVDSLAALLTKRDSIHLDKLLQEQLLGLSPLLCRELSYRATGETDTDTSTLASPADCAACILNFLHKPFLPVMLIDKGIPKDFSCVELGQYGSYYETNVYESCSAMLDAFYGKKERSERQRQRTQQLNKSITAHRDRVKRKLIVQQKELSGSLNREQLRQNADIIMANLYRIQKGDTVLIAENFYDPEMAQVRILLQPHLNAQQNAGKYYKDYAKAKNAERYLTQQIEKGKQELEYLNSVLDELSRAETEAELNEIKAELISQGYMRDTERKKHIKQPQPKPMEFVSSSGFPILVGRNNRQNDFLTLRLAGKNDIWLHTQKIHGSHVVILCGNTTPDDETMTEAAMLAAWYSQASDGQNVPVDTTLIRNIKKPNGAQPGMVIYDRYNTLYVTPEEALPEKLRKH